MQKIMNDLISREDAIDEIRFYIKEPNIFDDEIKIKGYNDGLEMAISILLMLPSAESEHKAPISYKEQISLDCSFCRQHECGDTLYESADWDGGIGFDYIRDIRFCPICGRELYGYEDEERQENE